jgi:hypothetical protein
MGFGTKRNEYSAKLGSNETASLCFRDPAEVKYVVRAESNDPIGEKNLAGAISIGSQNLAQPVEKSSERNKAVAAQSDQDDAVPHR